MRRALHSSYAQVVGLTLALSAVAALLGRADKVTLTNVLIVVTLAYSWNLVGGILGELSFAHIVFFGVGTYAVVLGELHEWPVTATALIAVTLTVACGALFVALGALARLDGLSWFVATLVLSMIAAGWVAETTWLGRGPGLIMPRLPWGSGQLVAGAIVVTTLAILVNIAVIRSQFGRRWVAVRDDPVAAEAHGIQIFRERLWAYGLSAPIACAAGWLHGLVIGYASPSVTLGVGPLVLVVLGVYIGGPGTVWGPFLGVVLLEGISVLLQRVWDNPDLAEYSRVLQYVLALVLVLVAFNRRRRVADRGDRPHVDVDAVAVVPRPALSNVSVLEVCHVSKAFGGVEVLDDIDLRLSAGSVTGLVGPNGAGKTTLLNMIAGQDSPTRGGIVIDGLDVTRRAAVRRSHLIRRGFQTARVFGGLSIVDNVRVGSQLSAPDAERLIRSLGVSAADRRAELTEGGERRMIEVAWAVAGDHPWLLFDEPLAGLDDNEVGVVLAILRRLADAGAGVIVVEHRLSEIVGRLDRLIVLDLGRVIADGPPEAVLHDPHVIKAYLGSTAQLEGAR